MISRIMIASVLSSTLVGAQASTVHIESDLSNSLPSTVIVGLGGKSVDESKERIRSAIKNSGMIYPRKRITINLSPADIPKKGAQFDLGIALSILLLSSQLPAGSLQSTTMVLGELGLDGSIKPIQGIIGHVTNAKQSGITDFIIPAENYTQASLVPDITLRAPGTLSDICKNLVDNTPIAIPKISVTKSTSRESLIDLSEVIGNELAKKALIIAAAGGHNILMNGPPGGGKTMLASTLPGIMPALPTEKVIESTHLHSLKDADGRLILTPPFRSPHSTASATSLIGGGTDPQPGEVTLAHNGVLFLDELPEFDKRALESLRQPLEDKRVRIARTSRTVVYPADFMLVATKNPCPCGNYGEKDLECSCTLAQADKYKLKLSGPLLDRIDIQIHVGKTNHKKLLNTTGEGGITSSEAKKLVATSRERQLKRQGVLNAHLSKKGVNTHLSVDDEAAMLLNSIATKSNVSARTYLKIVKVAQTIADMNSQPNISKNCMAFAVQLRL